MLFSLVILLVFFDHGQGYKAAVYEYYAKEGSSELDTINQNLEQYRTFIASAKNQSVNIAVFPEYGLTTVVKDPEYYAIEINTNDEIIKQLTTLTIDSGMYVVVNILEKEVSSNNGVTYYYNTNLVFDNNGNIITKYRKINLCNESKLTPGDLNQKNTFKSPFGTFALLTGCDILYKNSSRDFLNDKTIANVILPTALTSYMPFQLSLSLQYGYVIENGVNLLAAGYARPRHGLGGSGIYLADGTIVESYISDSPSSKPLVQEVNINNSRVENINCKAFTPFALPTDKDKSNVSDYFTGQNVFSANYSFVDVNLEKNDSSTEVCHKSFCCTFDLHIQNPSSNDVYKFVAFDGYENDDHIRLCSLVACKGTSFDTCGTRVNATTTFSKIVINVKVPEDSTAFYTPVTTNTYLLPLTGLNYCKNSTYVQLSSTTKKDNVLVFGIFGRSELKIQEKIDVDDVGSKKAEDDDNSAAGNIKMHIFSILTLVMIKNLIA